MATSQVTKWTPLAPPDTSVAGHIVREGSRHGRILWARKEAEGSGELILIDVAGGPCSEPSHSLDGKRAPQSLPNAAHLLRALSMCHAHPSKDRRN
eukprot:scaffold72150_cov26-Tisochrysis_lutea.AAC.4